MGSTEHQRGYAKGYSAGQKRVVRNWSSDLTDFRREQFRRQVFLVILPQLVSAPWQTNGETWKTMDQFIAGAWNFAEKAARGTTFSGENFALSPLTKDNADG